MIRKTRIMTLLIISILLIGTSKATKITKGHVQTSGEAHYKITTRDKARAKFLKILAFSKTHYVEKKSEEELMSGALKGMVGGLDPHSMYLTKEENKEFKENVNQVFGGVGVVITISDYGVKVISPLDGTPAKRAGIKSGDFITRISGKATEGKNLRDMSKLMRGEPETEVTFTIKRKGVEPFKVTLLREMIVVPSVSTDNLGNIAYIRIATFNSDTVEKLKEEYEQLKEKMNVAKIKSIILDLRGNPGGVLRAAKGVSDFFLNQGDKIVSTIGRAKTEVMYSEESDYTEGANIVVIIDEGSASASEIVSGALKDNKRAVIMGRTSFGKGSVQSYIELDDGSAVKITTSRYYTPTGTSIQATGIIPDIILRNMKPVEDKNQITHKKEADLEGHLLEEVKNKKPKLPEYNGSLKDDYYVIEASNLLKAFLVLRK